ncbi:MAG TPA: alpha/beta hydrolase domain-containing protein, partial [Rhodanobacteraceae bacterium]|nr:alpha/beta hydrolase domain-containing protein [Rhodanobacteraceae bacterium]
MIAAIEITSRAPFVGGASFGTVGAYERLDCVAIGELDPAHPGNRGIVNLDKAPRNARGNVEYRSDMCILRPANPERGNGRILYEVNNRGRMMLFANLCAGRPGNQPTNAADLGNALPLRRGFTLVWSGWDPGAPRANGGLGLDAPVATNDGKPIVRRIREEFISGTRGGDLQQFRLSYPAATRNDAVLSVRRTQTAVRQPVAFEFLDERTIRLAGGALPEPGSIYELRYDATNPHVLGIGFAATRDIISYLRNTAGGHDLVGCQPTHALAFGISQAGRYLRDHLAQGFNRDETGSRVFDGLFTHVAGIGRVFCNTEFGQPGRTRTWHEDHDFPEIEYPFATGALLRDDGAKLIETNTSTEYWQKGASLLHSDGAHDVGVPPNVRGYYLAGTQHGGKAGMPRDAGPCTNPRNWHDPMPAVRALLIALDEWVANGREPPPSRLPRIIDGTLVLSEAMAWPALPALRPPRGSNDVVALDDWTAPGQPKQAWQPLVPQVDADGNEMAGIRLPDIAVPRGTFTGWNLYRAPWPEGELADRDGTYLAFAETRAEREQSGDARLSLEERYQSPQAYATRVAEVVATLQRDRLLLEE